MSRTKVGSLAVVALVGLLIVAWFVVGTIQESTFHAPSPATMSRADNDVGSIESFLKQSGIATSSLAASKVEVCYNQNTAEGIGFRRSMYSYCYLRYVRGYSTALTKQAVVQKLSAAPASMLKKLGDTSGAQYSSCEVTSNVLKQTLRYRAANNSSSINDTFCGIPPQIQGLYSTIGAHLDKELSVRKFTQFDPTSVPTAADQIWLSYDVDYYQAKVY